MSFRLWRCFSILVLTDPQLELSNRTYFSTLPTTVKLFHYLTSLLLKLHSLTGISLNIPLLSAGPDHSLTFPMHGTYLTFMCSTPILFRTRQTESVGLYCLQSVLSVTGLCQWCLALFLLCLVHLLLLGTLVLK